jgi:hypothetical protein
MSASKGRSQQPSRVRNKQNGNGSLPAQPDELLEEVREESGLHLHWEGRRLYRSRIPIPRVLEPDKRLSLGTDSPNLVIEGDNLQVMVSLRSQFNAAVDICYIDPPTTGAATIFVTRMPVSTIPTQMTAMRTTSPTKTVVDIPSGSITWPLAWRSSMNCWPTTASCSPRLAMSSYFA